MNPRDELIEQAGRLQKALEAYIEVLRTDPENVPVRQARWLEYHAEQRRFAEIQRKLGGILSPE
jgi:hypothetical protein